MQHLLTEPLMMLLNRLVQAGSPEHKNNPASVQRAMTLHRRIGRAILLILAGLFAFSGMVISLTIPPDAYKGWAGWGFLLLAGSLTRWNPKQSFTTQGHLSGVLCLAYWRSCRGSQVLFFH